MNRTHNIWKEFNAQLLGFIKSRISHAETAEDILQDVFIKIHTRHTQIKDETKITSWVYQITRNAIIDYYRKNKLETTELNFDVSLPLDKEKDKRDLSKCLIPFLNNIPTKEKDVLLKTVFGGDSQVDYAKANSISYSTVKSRVQRGRIHLKEQFYNCCQLEADKYGNILNSKTNGCNC